MGNWQIYGHWAWRVWARGYGAFMAALHSGPPSRPAHSPSFLLQHINPVAASLIQKMLQTDPTARPTIHELLNDEFFTSGYIPARLPITCLTIAPRFSIAPSSLDPSNRKPLTVLNKGKTADPQREPRLQLWGWVAPRAQACRRTCPCPWIHSARPTPGQNALLPLGGP